MKHLLASHGSVGSIAAENVAIASCNAGDTLDHLYVIPSWWADMTGDDWLNNGASRNTYRHYLEDELHTESKQVSKRIKAKCQQKNISYQLMLIVGDSSTTLTTLGQRYEKIYLGSKRPKSVEGLKDCMLTKRVKHKLQGRLEIIPYPNG